MFFVSKVLSLVNLHIKQKWSAIIEIKSDVFCLYALSDKIQTVSCAGFCKWGPSVLPAVSPRPFQVSLALRFFVSSVSVFKEGRINLWFYFLLNVQRGSSTHIHC